MPFSNFGKIDLFAIKKVLRGYDSQKLLGDSVAGFNAALLGFPQGMAYAIIAGLPIQAGIFGSAIGALAGGVFGGSRFITLGPSNATAVILGSAFASAGIISAVDRANAMPVLLLMMGAFILIGAFFHVAQFIQYISRTVVIGYITAGAVQIIIGQIPYVLGFKASGSSATVVEKLLYIFNHLHLAEIEPLLLSGVTAAVFYTLGYFKQTRKLPNGALVLVMMSAFGSLIDSALIRIPLWQTGSLDFLNSIHATQWPITLPQPSVEGIRQLANAAFALSMMCVLEGTSIGKSLAARSGEKLNTDQEVYGIGMSNLSCSFLGGMPASGSLTRSVLTWSSGARTAMASVINGGITIAGAFAVGHWICFIPSCVLGTLVIATGISLYNRRAIKIVTTTTKDDRWTFWATFLGGLLFPLDTAIYIGTVLSIILFLRRAATPELVEYTINDEGTLAEKAPGTVNKSAVSIIHAEGDLFFGSAELFRDQMRLAADNPNLKIIICKMRNARHVDATTVMAIEELVKYMNENGRYLILSEVKPSVMKALEVSGLRKFLEGDKAEKFVFEDTPENFTLSTAKALRRCKEILGSLDADVQIMVKPKNHSREV